MLGLQESNLSPPPGGGGTVGSKGPILDLRRPLDSKVGEKLVFIFGRGPTTRRGGPSIAHFNLPLV